MPWSDAWIIITARRLQLGSVTTVARRLPQGPDHRDGGNQNKNRA